MWVSQPLSHEAVKADFLFKNFFESETSAGGFYSFPRGEQQLEMYLNLLKSRYLVRK